MLRLSFYTTIGPMYIISIFITPLLASNIWAISLKSLLWLFPKFKQITALLIIRCTICRYSFIDLSVKPFCKLLLNISKFAKIPRSPNVWQHGIAPPLTVAWVSSRGKNLLSNLSAILQPTCECKEWKSSRDRQDKIPRLFSLHLHCLSDWSWKLVLWTDLGAAGGDLKQHPAGGIWGGAAPGSASRRARVVEGMRGVTV